MEARELGGQEDQQPGHRGDRGGHQGGRQVLEGGAHGFRPGQAPARLTQRIAHGVEREVGAHAKKDSDHEHGVEIEPPVDQRGEAQREGAGEQGLGGDQHDRTGPAEEADHNGQGQEDRDDCGDLPVAGQGLHLGQLLVRPLHPDFQSTAILVADGIQQQTGPLEHRLDVFDVGTGLAQRRLHQSHEAPVGQASDQARAQRIGKPGLGVDETGFRTSLVAQGRPELAGSLVGQAQLGRGGIDPRTGVGRSVREQVHTQGAAPDRLDLGLEPLAQMAQLRHRQIEEGMAAEERSVAVGLDPHGIPPLRLHLLADAVLDAGDLGRVAGHHRDGEQVGGSEAPLGLVHRLDGARLLRQQRLEVGVNAQLPGDGKADHAQEDPGQYQLAGVPDREPDPTGGQAFQSAASIRISSLGICHASPSIATVLGASVRNPACQAPHRPLGRSRQPPTSPSGRPRPARALGCP